MRAVPTVSLVFLNFKNFIYFIELTIDFLIGKKRNASRKIVLILSPSGGMVDAADSKSAGSDIVRVRVSPWAPSISLYSVVFLTLIKTSQGG